MDQTSLSTQPETVSAPVKKRLPITAALTRMWIPVRAKITLPFILIALAMAAFVAFLLYQIVFENIDQRYNTQLVESGKLASEWMVKEEDTRLSSLRLLAFTVGVGDLLKARDADSLRLAALGSTWGKQEDAVEFLDTEGNLILSIRHRPGSIYADDYTYSTQGDANYRQWSFVEQVLTRNTDAQGDKYSGLALASWGNYYYVSGPVYDSSGTFAGVILVGRLMANMATLMHLDTGAQVTIYDPEGNPIASTFSNPTALTSALVTGVFDRQQDSSLRRDDLNQSEVEQNRRNLSYRSMDYGEILGPWKVRGSQELGLIGTALPKDLLVQTSEKTRTQIALFVGLAMFIVIVMGGTVANLITHPLLELVKASKEVARGNWNVEVKPHANDEVAVLTENFNQMIASIQQSHADLVKAYNSTLEGWARATGMRDNETEAHMLRVTEITIRLAEKMGLYGEQLTHIYRGSLLHDVGKIGVPDSILKKPGKLTDEEWSQMRKHPQLAYEMLSSIEYLRPSLDIPYCHHERWDGRGYPRGIQGEEIPFIARIFMIVDVWDAMTSDRIYRKALSEDEAYQYICETRGSHFDPQVADSFLELMGKC